MDKTPTFDNLQAWHMAREFVKQVYLVAHQGELARSSSLKEQLFQSSVSMIANLSEGLEQRDEKKLATSLASARSALRHIQSHLYVACDVGFLTQSELALHIDAVRMLDQTLCSLLPIRSQHPILQSVTSTPSMTE